MSELMLSHHARRRVLEFGIGLDVVDRIARRPDVTHTNTRGETVCTADAHPDWTVVVAPDDVVVTVLRRTLERWEHEPVPARTSPSTATPPVVEGGPRDATPVTQPGVARTRRRSTRRPPVASSAVTVRRVDPATMREAMRLADGDVRRLVINPDASVSVLNRPRGSR